MKTLIILTLIFTANAFAMKGKMPERKVSNSNYFMCTLERDNVDKKVFKKEVHFPFPSEKGETYELKGSMRWNDYKIVFSQEGEVKISISEMIGSEKVKAEKIHQMGKEAQFESFKVQVDVKKDDVVVPYFVQCSPE
jgi:hypothetical protein